MVVTSETVSTHAVMTPANAVTMARILLSPVLVALIYLYAPSWWVLIFGFLAMMTDKLDGILARKYGTSAFGTFLDPLADKFMVLGSLAVLVVHDWIGLVPFALIAGRENRYELVAFLVGAFRGVSVPARMLAKYKTWSQSFVVGLALVPGLVANASWVLTTVLWVSVALTLYTFWQYMRDGYVRAQPSSS